jgi:PilZ domain-containing protein
MEKAGNQAVMPHSTPIATEATERRAERRRVPRIPFKATSVVTEAGSAQIVVAQTTELSRFGCFVQTKKPYSKGTRVHIEVAEAGTTFVASGAVAYVTSEGMGVVFSLVEPDNQAILENWLSRTPRRSVRYSIGATAEVKDLGSRSERVLITRDLSAGGCFVSTTTPLPPGSRIHVRITHRGDEFHAIGRVTANVSAQGMGLEFVEVSPQNRAILTKWLAEEHINQ